MNNINMTFFEIKMFLRPFAVALQVSFLELRTVCRDRSCLHSDVTFSETLNKIRTCFSYDIDISSLCRIAEPACVSEAACRHGVRCF